MIFVTVGAQMPFDRLTMAIDTWAKTKSDIKIFAQIGNSSYKPENIDWINHLEPNEYREYIKKSELVVAHAGMGTILSVLEIGTHLLIMPRRGIFHETRNDHQLATAKSFSAHNNIQLANDEYELQEKLSQWNIQESSASIGPHASEELLSRISSFIECINN